MSATHNDYKESFLSEQAARRAFADLLQRAINGEVFLITPEGTDELVALLPVSLYETLGTFLSDEAIAAIAKGHKQVKITRRATLEVSQLEDVSYDV